MPGMDLSAYRALWRTLGVPGLLIGGLLARLPNVVLMIPLSFLAKDASGGFGWAGVVAAAYAIGTAVASPWWARVADRRGPSKVLVATGFACSALLASLAAIPSDWFRILPVLALVAGMMLPPVASIARSVWPRIVAGRRLRTAYALDASSVEVLYVVGPLLGALLVTFASPRAGLLAAAGVGAVTVWWYAQQQPDAVVVASDDEPRPTLRQLLWHRHRLALIVSFALTVTAFSAVSLSIVAYADHHGDRLIAGVLETVWASGSLLGGLVAGALPGRRSSYVWRRSALMGGGMALVALTTWSPWVMAVTMFAAGTVLAPAVGALFERLGALTPDSVRTEVFGWMQGSAMLGGAAGSALAGLVVELAGVPWVLGMAAFFVLAGSAVLVGVPPHVPEPQTKDVTAGEPVIASA